MSADINLRTRLKDLIETSEYESHRAVSQMAGLSHPQVSSIIRGDFDGKSGGPGVFGIHRLAQVLGTTVDYLLSDEPAETVNDIGDFNRIPREDVTFDRFLEDYERGGRTLAGLSHLKDHFDLYAVPDERAEMPKLLRLGRATLFAMRIGSTDISRGQREIRAASLAERSSMLEMHRRVDREGIVADTHFADHKAVTRPLHVRALSSRLGLKVDLPGGSHAVALRCAPIPV